LGQKAAMKKFKPVKYSFEERDALINQWRLSGKTKKEFSAYRGINPQTFYSWFKLEAKPIENNSPKGFIPLLVNHSPVSGVFAELTTPSGIRIAFHQPVSAAFLKALV
jgi:hypothetical protein